MDGVNGPDVAMGDVRLSIILLAVNAAGGGVFGYSTGIIAGALPAMEDDFSQVGNSPTVQGVVTCSILLGALIGAVFGSAIAEIIGKRRAVMLTGVVAVVSGLGSALSPWLVAIILFRELQGIAVGLSSVVCPTYVAELAPARFRGSLGVSFQLSITLGIFLSYLISLAFISVPGDFRWMFGLSVVPGIAMMAIFFFMPKPPSERHGAARQMLADDREDLGLASHASDEEDDSSDDGQVEEKKPNAYVLLFKKYPKPTFVALMLAVGLQLTGINAVLYYAPVIFTNAGFTGETASLWATAAIGGWNFLCTFIAVFLVDRLGRRPLLLTGLVAMTISLVLLGFTFEFLTGTASLVCSLLLIMLFIIGFEAGIGSLFWALLTEIFADEVREAGATLMNVIQWTFNILLSVSFPALIALLSQAVVFWIFALVAVVVLVVLFVMLKETKAVESNETVQTAYIVEGNEPLTIALPTSFDTDEHIFSDAEESTKSYF
mmetsp:Transcript_1665/g.5912  ORF Transcript_1665/g.5912 Transcript_1665/m.5912 type:complete len:491 (+) Transcript_1665:41-1513(+)